jgi:hypothetical protein
MSKRNLALEKVRPLSDPTTVLYPDQARPACPGTLRKSLCCVAFNLVSSSPTFPESESKMFFPVRPAWSGLLKNRPRECWISISCEWRREETLT